MSLMDSEMVPVEPFDVIGLEEAIKQDGPEHVSRSIGIDVSVLCCALAGVPLPSIERDGIKRFLKCASKTALDVLRGDLDHTPADLRWTVRWALRVRKDLRPRGMSARSPR